MSETVAAPESLGGESTPGRHLRGNLGVASIVFMVVAAAAPLGVIGGVVPLGIASGNGAGFPATFIAATVILLFFSVGFTAMTPHVQEAGAFFSYVRTALGFPTLSSRVLAVLLSAEIAIVAILDLVIVARGGDHGLSTGIVNPHAIASGSLGIGLLFAIISYVGFEATAIFRDEARTPERTIPRATYPSPACSPASCPATTWCRATSSRCRSATCCPHR